MKLPGWHRDEIILALDLYHSLESREMDSKNSKVITLSRLLKELPFYKTRNNDQKFRSPYSVGLKLRNFQSIDPRFKGKGMYRHSKLDKEIFFEFEGRNNRLKSIADHIKKTISNKELVVNLSKISDEEGDDMVYVKEGKIIYKLHKYKERNKKLNRKKKDKYLKDYGKLNCEVCDFDFYQVYGELGKGFMECHHKVPLSEINEEIMTSLEDLALVCANCHRMLHREIETLTVRELKKRMNID